MHVRCTSIRDLISPLRSSDYMLPQRAAIAMFVQA